ncbi:MAG TPA: hypothetical protein VM029_02210 [Opitutaceae bacterium]|nr:hypothetical protein [Opitutaceae bacterium]
MKFCRHLFAALAACLCTAAAFAADASPSGTWKWSVGRTGGQAFEQILKLEFKGGTLAGTLQGSQSGKTSFPDTPITDASFKDGVVRFSVTREAAGNKVTTKYQGKLEGDSIKGTSERPNLQGGGAPVTREWDARRTK